jgi:predicted CXXCH cytochrome family protein
MNAPRWSIVALVLLCAGTVGGVRTQAQTPQPAPTPQEQFKGDAHETAGLTCESCHAAPVNNQYAAIARTRIAPLCAKCHSDAEAMRRAKPDARADQYALYLTSKHGQQMAKGETRVATCTDCHGAHGVVTVRDPRSPVAPQNVAATCTKCHGDPARMEPFERYGNPEADWKNSVHAKALVQGDLSAPTCSTCHGGHGPSPANATSLLLCGQCHVREAELYTKSPKKAAFDKIDEPGCVSCHSNHEVEKPSDDLVSAADPAPCSVCHKDDKVKGASDIDAVGKGLGRLRTAIDRAAAVLDQAEVAGMLVEDGFIKLRTAQEQQVLARLTVHAFAAQPFAEIEKNGLSAAAEAESVGHQALAELRRRHQGLAFAALFILGFLVALGVKIRRLPPPPTG